MITDWRDLKPGIHVRLACGCAGFVVFARLDATEDDRNTGFGLLYTKGLSCKSPADLEQSYRNGYGPFYNYFNYDLKEQAMPAQEEPPPDWWEAVRHHERFAFERWMPVSENNKSVSPPPSPVPPPSGNLGDSLRFALRLYDGVIVTSAILQITEPDGSTRTIVLAVGCG